MQTLDDPILGNAVNLPLIDVLDGRSPSKVRDRGAHVL